MYLSLVIFPDSPYHGLDQAVHAFILGAVHHVETKLRFALGTFAKANGQRAAQTILNVRRFVARLLGIPGEDPQIGKVARLPFGPLRASHEILRMLPVGVSDTIEFE